MPVLDKAQDLLSLRGRWKPESPILALRSITRALGTRVLVWKVLEEPNSRAAFPTSLAAAEYLH